MLRFIGTGEYEEVSDEGPEPNKLLSFAPPRRRGVRRSPRGSKRLWGCPRMPDSLRAPSGPRNLGRACTDSIDCFVPGWVFWPVVRVGSRRHVRYGFWGCARWQLVPPPHR